MLLFACRQRSNAFNSCMLDSLLLCVSIDVYPKISMRQCWILCIHANESLSVPLHIKVVMREAWRQRNAQKRTTFEIFISAKELSHTLILVPQAGALVHLGASSGQCGDWNRQHRRGRLALSRCSEADAGFWNTI